ncbi:hypothetical protein A2U01_0059708, partial [Trifolium medium]|nr:hypothetical protein [Trifolium medium]
MELKQGNMSVAEYAAKFESLCAFSPHYNTTEAEYDKICDEDGKAKSNYFKAMSDKKRKGQYRGKPYGDKGKKGVESSGGRK